VRTIEPVEDGKPVVKYDRFDSLHVALSLLMYACMYSRTLVAASFMYSQSSKDWEEDHHGYAALHRYLQTAFDIILTFYYAIVLVTVHGVMYHKMLRYHMAHFGAQRQIR
jgi:hypothetical protein